MQRVPGDCGRGRCRRMMFRPAAFPPKMRRKRIGSLLFVKGPDTREAARSAARMCARSAFPPERARRAVAPRRASRTARRSRRHDGRRVSRGRPSFPAGSGETLVPPGFEPVADLLRERRIRGPHRARDPQSAARQASRQPRDQPGDGALSHPKRRRCTGPRSRAGLKRWCAKQCRCCVRRASISTRMPRSPACSRSRAARRATAPACFRTSSQDGGPSLNKYRCVPFPRGRSRGRGPDASRVLHVARGSRDRDGTQGYESRSAPSRGTHLASP